MAEVDTSSYPKPAAPVNMLDTAAKFQGLESGGLTIQKQNLDLINQRFGTFAKQLTALANKPDLNEGDITGFINNDVKLGILHPDMAGKIQSMIPAKANSAQLQTWLQQQLANAMTMKEALDYHLGQPGIIDTGQQQIPTVTSPKPGFGTRATGPGIQTQIPPTATGIDPNTNQPRLMGAQAPDLVPGSGAVPSPAYVPRLPVAPMPKSNKDQSQAPFVNANAPGVPRGPATAVAPLFEEGRKLYTADQDLATQKLTAIKPALQALPMIDGIMAGPGTAAFTHALAGLKAFGIIPTGLNDPIAVRQEVVKKLNQYIQSNPVGQRSDAAQTLAEASSPTPNVQILPALKKLTQDAVALDRVQAARAGAFEGNDYSKYGQHRSTFPAQMDERAFGLDMMKPEERQALLDEMKKKKDTFEGKRFWRSLAIVKKQGLINPGGE